MKCVTYFVVSDVYTSFLLLIKIIKMIGQAGVCFLRVLDGDTLRGNSKWLEQKGNLES